MSVLALPAGLLLSYYGDDFTGSTDAMEALALAGVPTILFVDTPTPERLRAASGFRAVGIAGVARSKSPAWMDENLPPIYAALKDLDPPLCHYKVCSTFDSAPEVGSIGRAIELARGQFGPAPIPLLVGAPALKRYTLFGNLFATVGQETHRIDRHPTMAHHPVTPMGEGDLRQHLAKQTALRIALLDILALNGRDPGGALAALLADDPDVVLFDVLDQVTLTRAGGLIWQGREHRRFVVGSSGVEYALVAHWREAGLLPEADPPASPGAVDHVVVASGSCSPVTAAQLDWALAHGYADVTVDACALVDEGSGEAAVEQAIGAARVALGAGQSVAVYTARGPQDPSIQALRTLTTRIGLDPATAGERVGQRLGQIAAALTPQTGRGRLVIAGGDTSGQCSQSLGLYALTMLSPLAPGAPLCLGRSDEAGHDGLQIVLKGGQVGQPDFFDAVRRGGVA